MTQAVKAMETFEYLCISCPIGCQLEVDAVGRDIIEVRGFTCKRGERFATQEHTNPTRMVSTTVRVRNGVWGRLPVKTSAPVHKHMVDAVAEATFQIVVRAPVRCGDVIASNVANTGADLVATRDMPYADRKGQLEAS